MKYHFGYSLETKHYIKLFLTKNLQIMTKNLSQLLSIKGNTFIIYQIAAQSAKRTIKTSHKPRIIIVLAD